MCSVVQCIYYVICSKSSDTKLWSPETLSRRNPRCILRWWPQAPCPTLCLPPGRAPGGRVAAWSWRAGSSSSSRPSNNNIAVPLYKAKSYCYLGGYFCPASVHKVHGPVLVTEPQHVGHIAGQLTKLNIGRALGISVHASICNLYLISAVHHGFISSTYLLRVCYILVTLHLVSLGFDVAEVENLQVVVIAESDGIEMEVCNNNLLLPSMSVRGDIVCNPRLMVATVGQCLFQWAAIELHSGDCQWLGVIVLCLCVLHHLQLDIPGLRSNQQRDLARYGTWQPDIEHWSS